MSDTSELVSRLNFLVSLNDPEKGGPYGGFAARACMEAMQEASSVITRLETSIALLPLAHQPATAERDAIIDECISKIEAMKIGLQDRRGDYFRRDALTRALAALKSEGA